MVPFANQSLPLVALQYELALLVGQDMRLGPMLRRFFPPALKMLGCRAAHVWLRSAPQQTPEHRFAYPSRDASAWREDAALAAAIEAYREAPALHRQCCLRDTTWVQFLPLGNIGYCALVSEGGALQDDLSSALAPVLERLALACRAALDHEETEQLRATAAENELRLRTVMEAVGEVIFQTNWAGRLSFVNPAWQRITGLAVEDCLGHELADFFCTQDSDVAGAALRSVLEGTQQSLRFEARLRAQDGSRPWVSVQVERRSNLGSTNTGLTGTMVDVTDQHLMIEELIQARARAEDASKAKSAFLANMSHEIRTPMNGVIGMAQLALEEPLSPQVRHYMEMILGSAEHLLTIINDILDFSKIEAGRLDFHAEDFDLHALLRETMAGLQVGAASKGLALQLELAPALPERVHGDPARLKQVLLNLLGNALKFTTQGSVRLLAGPADEEPGGQLLRFRVIDTGIGIAADKQHVIFDAFSQADGSISRAFGGTGLGLTISRRLVDLMGGSLTLQSTPGQGSEFSFSARLLPASTPQPLPTPMCTPASVAAGTPDGGQDGRLAGGLDILVAEDNDINRRLMDGLLRKMGHRVSFAHDGQAAVDACTAHRFDLVLMDVQMPVMDGLAATRRIRADETRDGRVPVPVIALTANAMQGDREHCLAAGMNGYLTKPLRRAELEAVLDGIAAATGRS